MSAANKGGPAFPCIEVIEYGSGPVEHQHFGVSIRDYFAAKAPITVEDAMLACGWSTDSIGMLGREARINIFEVLAELRGEYADAMLAERAK